MYPTMDEPETYSDYGRTGYVPPNYGTPHVSSAPPTFMTHSVMTPQWSTDLFHCVDDPSLCLVTCFCPCFTFGRIAEIVDKGNPTCGSSGLCYGLLAPTGLACLYSCNYRSRMRAQFELPEAPCMDCFVHFCCEACALCQEYRQLQSYGFDLSLGWEANAERSRRHGVTVAPGIPPGMMR
ncbi:hypothetical protein QN277_005171 [Acacia crassicarpa]|uniref:Uncharacterized protein n=1 Tax=Acacia crassicarpa TaxID=499986 RepID=A0AAE1MB77_9FABA|nr:hypothetical protein QN277_005171 [Acacia crassicarpa]